MANVDPVSAVIAAATPPTVNLFASVAKRLTSSVASQAKRAAIASLAALQGYGPYLEETNERVSTFKSFANPTQPVSVLDNFVSTRLQKTQNLSITQDDVVDMAAGKSKIVISATAGYGKSMLMRFIALSLYEHPRGRVPIFVELRHLNRMQEPDLLTYIHSSYNRLSIVERVSFDNLLESGAFSFIFDGFDELNHEYKPQVESQILEISRKYSLNSFIVSGRPDDRFGSWRSFRVLKILPMAKTQVIELINKLDHDRGTKKRFIEKIKKGLYETHESFLSTPLLAILMLLTYEENANIPDKIHLFYNKAFETLFHKHDAMKEQYDRQRKSALQIDDFSKAFAVFCLNTYVLERVEFTKSELLKFVQQALNYESLNVNAEDFLFDLEEAVCLLQREGMSYFFVHRSFQEFFTAQFLANCPQDIRDEFIDRVCTRYWDNVLPMLFDMASSQIEPSWVDYNTENFLNNVGFSEGKTLPTLAKFPMVIFHVPLKGDAVLVSFGNSDFGKYVSVMNRFYPDKSMHFGELNFELMEKSASDLPGFKEEYEKASVEPIFSGQNGRVIAITLDKRHLGWLESCGLRKFADDEFLKISKIYKTLRKDQADKNFFLKKLFDKSR